jgi:hypothetical protein
MSMKKLICGATAGLFALSGVALAGVDANVNIGIRTPAPPNVNVRIGAPAPPQPRVTVIEQKGDNGKHLGHYKKKGKKKHGKHKD